jgi:GntR family transcriptional regulator
VSNILRPAEALSLRISGPALPELVANTLREAIGDGRLVAGQRLPSEPQLAEQLGVSRATLRQALALLTQEGLLVRQHGRGTFVSSLPASALRGNLAELTSTTRMILEQGYQPGVAGTRVQVGIVEQRLADLFDMPAGTRFVHISRTRLANGQPAVYSEEYLPEAILGAHAQALQNGPGDWSLYDMLTQAGVAVSFATCKVVPAVVTEALASCFHIPVGHLLLLLKQLHYTQSGQPVLYCENYHNSDIIEFQLVRKA